MAIDSTCTGCGKTLRVPDEFAGKQARCPVCSAIYTVPAVSTGPSVASPWESYDNNIELKPVELTSIPSTPAVPGNNTPLVPDPRLQSPTAAGPAPTGKVLLFVAKTPTGAEYGPVPADTIFQWEKEGRLNDSCFVRLESESQWIAFPSWKFRYQPRANPFAGSYQGGGSLGQVPVPVNQSVSYLKQGQGVTVLILSIVSWVLCMTFIGSFVCALICVILGTNDLNAIRRGEVSPDNKNLTIIGLVIGGINLAVCGLGLLLLIFMAIFN